MTGCSLFSNTVLTESSSGSILSDFVFATDGMSSKERDRLCVFRAPPSDVSSSPVALLTQHVCLSSWPSVTWAVSVESWPATLPCTSSSSRVSTSPSVQRRTIQCQVSSIGPFTEVTPSLASLLASLTSRCRSLWSVSSLLSAVIYLAHHVLTAAAVHIGKFTFAWWPIDLHVSCEARVYVRRLTMSVNWNGAGMSDFLTDTPLLALISILQRGQKSPGGNPVPVAWLSTLARGGTGGMCSDRTERSSVLENKSEAQFITAENYSSSHLFSSHVFPPSCTGQNPSCSASETQISQPPYKPVM